MIIRILLEPFLIFRNSIGDSVNPKILDEWPLAPGLIPAPSLSVGDEMSLVLHARLDDEESNNWEIFDRVSRGRTTNEVPSMITIYPHPSSSALEVGIDLSQSVDARSKDCCPNTLFTCIILMENELCIVDCRIGMEMLVMAVNSELVNLKKQDSIAQAIVCGTEVGYKSETERLRNLFSSCFPEHAYKRRSHEHVRVTDLNNLKLPALRVLASSLELVSMLDANFVREIDLTSMFWVTLLRSMTETVQFVAESRLEATLSIKCIHLLYKLQPSTMGPYIRYSLLPYLLYAFEFGRENGDRMLLREAKTILKHFGIEMVAMHN